MDREIWREIPRFEGKYRVSSHGAVFSYKTGLILKPQRLRDGYEVVRLYHGRGQYEICMIHRIVMAAFVCEAPEFQVNHKNLIKADNRLSNLEYCTPQQNVRHYWAMRSCHGCT